MAQKGINLMIYDFKTEMVASLNNNGLPISIKRQVLEEILTEVIKAEERVIREEQIKYQEELKEDAKKDIASNKNGKLKKGENKDVNGNK